MIRTAIAVLALCASSVAAAHSFWLQPDDYTIEPGEEIDVGFKVGDVGAGAEAPADWGLYWERIASFRLYGPSGVEDRQATTRTSDSGQAGMARFSVRSPGTYVLAFESNPSFSDLDAEAFDRYVEHEGLAVVAADRARRDPMANGTELYARRAKALLQVGANPTGNVTRPIGHTLEIVPLVNPFSLAPGDALDLQVFWRGRPLEGAMLNAAPLGGAATGETSITSADGVVRVARADGPMLYSVVWGVPAPNDARADYFTIFASLTVGS